MKRSRAIPLVLLGTFSLLAAGCGDNQDELEAYEQSKQVNPQVQQIETTQNQYKSIEDCHKDWGKDERECAPAKSGGGYVGPRYIWTHGGGYPMAINSDGTTRSLPNSYLAHGAQPAAVTALREPMIVGTGTGAASVGRTAGVARSVSVARGGFGGTAHGFSAGG